MDDLVIKAEWLKEMDALDEFSRDEVMLGVIKYLRTGVRTEYHELNTAAAFAYILSDIDGDLGDSVKVVDPLSFDIVWSMYDKKTDRKRCEKIWRRMSKKDKQAAMEAIPRYVASTPNKKFRKDLSTYLHNRSWENEIISDDGNTNRRQQLVGELSELLGRGGAGLPF